eukprot:6468786-Amphidinium_carterae.1
MSWALAALRIELCVHDESQGRQLVAMASSSNSALKTAWTKATATVKEKKLLGPKDIHTAVRKCISDSLADMSLEELDCVKVDGMTCRERLTKDKKEWLEGTADFTMGSGYYDGIRALYTGRGRIENQLEYTTGDTVPSALVKAIGKARKHPPNRGPLLTYMRSAKSLGRGEVIAVLKLMCSLRPSVKAEQCHVGMELVSLLSSLDVWTTYSDEYAIMRPKLDEILLQASYVNSVPAGVTPIDWLQQHSSLWPLVLPQTHVDAIVALPDGQAIVTLKTQLKAVMASPALGFRLFAWASKDIASSC